MQFGKLHEWYPFPYPREPIQIHPYLTSDLAIFNLSLLSITSKLLIKITHHRITSYLETSYPVAPNQWGFLSATHALISAVHD